MIIYLEATSFKHMVIIIICRSHSDNHNCGILCGGVVRVSDFFPKSDSSEGWWFDSPCHQLCQFGFPPLLSASSKFSCSHTMSIWCGRIKVPCVSKSVGLGFLSTNYHLMVKTRLFRLSLDGQCKSSRKNKEK